jgi:drug/metabolite transporter (DMT)-like permease
MRSPRRAPLNASPMVSENLRAAIVLTVAMLFFAIEDVFIKLLASELPFSEVLGLLGLAGFLYFWARLRLDGERFWTADLLHPTVVVRNSTEAVAAIGLVVALALTDLSVTAAIIQAVPLFIALGAAVFLNEPVGWRRTSAIVIGFLGVLMVVRPGLDGFEPVSLMAVIAAVTLAIRDLATRQVPASISSAHLSASAFLAILVAAVLMGLALGETPVLPDLRQTGLGLACVSMTIAGYTLLVTATRIGEPSALAPVRYSRLVFALILAVIVFGERLDAMTLAGAAIIVLSGAYTMWRTARRAARLARAPQRP